NRSDFKRAVKGDARRLGGQNGMIKTGRHTGLDDSAAISTCCSHRNQREEPSNEVWEKIARLMDREVESFCLASGDAYAYGHCTEYLVKSNDLDGVLSLIEICA